MSIVSIEFHNGELQKLVEYCYEAFVADTARFLYKKGIKSHTTKGLVEAGDRRYLRASQLLANFSNTLTKEQRDLINESFCTMVDFQTQLRLQDLSDSEKRAAAKSYKRAAGEYERAIQVTSLLVSYDLASQMTKAEAFKMATTCEENSLSALEMSKGIMSAYQRSLTQTAPKTRKTQTETKPRHKAASKPRDQAASKVPAVMMNHLTKCVKDAKSD